MKLAFFDEYRIGVVDTAAQKVADVTQIVRDHEIPTEMKNVIEEFDLLRNDFAKNPSVARRVNLRDVKLLPPMPNPSKILCALANFTSHSQEFGRKPPVKPELFLKAPSCLIGPGDTILLPHADYSVVHHEGEIAIVIGKKAKNVKEEDAMSYVFGYTCFMDISARGLNDLERTMMFRMKSFDTFGPLGPFITTRDELPNPRDIELNLWVNGQLRQHGNTKDMVYSIPRLVSYASSAVSLYPGDLIATGTPSGVGEIKEGDVLKIAVGGIGEMEVNVGKEKSEDRALESS